MTNLFSKFNNTLNEAKDNIKREYNARFITKQTFFHIEKNFTNITVY